ncbi:MAG TPA: LLM class flavin-dependent oxidoreductase [Acidothermaceae bacterium]|jgi:alkanesulfonate monooxygenase SsuD/methylene tetrahydromethanopterin reductase-like flavin-dependent oxidoreductase (luciferase family)|nr:LLM class flavin-dependent oxidoreductase [Acidothermaceae bacterium]
MTGLKFGLSLSTSAAPGTDPVRMAMRAEELEFDFVSAPDHPSGSDPSFETWTLLTWIAASTSRIGIATKVLCGPLRLPALTAKMAETLQRLSGGRFILGLGAGFSDHEMRSFGVAPRTAREKVDGLEEAVRIISQLWSQPTVDFDGHVYSTHAAEIEPKPDQKIPIWLGAFGDRALAVTGRLADGWIPSFGYAPPDKALIMLEKVRSSAAGAGRDPDAITCAYNMEIRAGAVDDDLNVVSGSVAQVIERLLGFVDIGFTAMNFAPVGPDPDRQLQLLANEVIPAVRAGVSTV